MFVDTELGRLHVRTRGDGPPTVLWHSLFVDSTSWKRLEDRLATDRRLILIDGPCHGSSAPHLRPFALQDCAAAAVAVLDSLRIGEPVDWVGNAWGGHVGLVFAAAFSDRCGSLITVGTPVHALSKAERKRIRPLVSVYRLTGPISLLVSAVSDALLGKDLHQTDEEATRLTGQAFRRAGRRGMHVAMRSMMLGRPDLTTMLPRVLVPTLLVVAADDPSCDVETARAVAANLPDGDIAIVPGAGHVAPLFTDPAALAAVIRAFWQERTTVGS